MMWLALRRRLTTGEMVVGPIRAVFGDEISTGLDSSTTFSIIKCLRNFTHYMDVSHLSRCIGTATLRFCGNLLC